MSFSPSYRKTPPARTCTFRWSPAFSHHSAGSIPTLLCCCGKRFRSGASVVLPAARRSHRDEDQRNVFLSVSFPADISDPVGRSIGADFRFAAVMLGLQHAGQESTTARGTGLVAPAAQTAILSRRGVRRSGFTLEPALSNIYRHEPGGHRSFDHHLAACSGRN